MVTRKTQYGWMATGGLLCLFALVLACKLRDGPRAAAQGDPLLIPDPKPSEKKAETPKKDGGDPKKEGADLVPLDAAGSPLPPIDDGAKLAIPVSLLTPPPLDDKKVQATMPLPSPAPLAGPLPSPPPAPGSLMPTTYSPDPVAGAAGTGTEPGAASGGPMPAGPLSPLPVSMPSGAPTVAQRPSPAVATPPPVKLAGPPAPPAAESQAGPATPSAPLPPPAASSGTPLIPPAGRTPTWDKPATPPPPQTEAAETHPLPGEPPLAPSPGPVQTYQVHSPETMRDLARRTLGSAERWTDIHKLNPTLKPETTLAAGTVIRLPGDACVVGDEAEPVKPLPAMHPKAGPAKPKVVLPLTGTYPANLDDKKTMTLPTAIREQLSGADTVLVSPGPDQCLWLTNQAHLERLAQRLEQSPAREIDVRVFKRLYYAQTEKAPLGPEGRVAISERLAQFAGLHQEVILVGIDDHFEVWDAGRWRQYTQQKGTGRAPAAEQD